MKENPLDELPRALTPEATRDKLSWIEKMIPLKGRERKKAIEQFVDRYGELPHLPDVLSR